jgi:hypothetical protein
LKKFLFLVSGHLGQRAGPADSILEEDHPMTIFFYQSLVPIEQLDPEKKILPS